VQWLSCGELKGSEGLDTAPRISNAWDFVIQKHFLCSDDVVATIPMISLAGRLGQIGE
jgi:hypothetical protein